MSLTERLVVALGATMALAGPTAALAAAPYEPNETPAAAYGPVGYAPALAVLKGALETTNDADWFGFYVPAGDHQVVAEVANTSAPERPDEPYSLLAFRVTDSQGEDADGDPFQERVDYGETISERLTLRGPARYNVVVRCAGGYDCDPAPGQATYRLTLSPQPSFVVGLPVAPPSVVLPPVVPIPAPPVAGAAQTAQLAVARATRTRSGKRRFSIAATAAAAGQIVTVTTYRSRGSGLRKVGASRHVTLRLDGTRARRSVNVSVPRGTRSIRVSVRLGAFWVGAASYSADRARRTLRIAR